MKLYQKILVVAIILILIIGPCLVILKEYYGFVGLVLLPANITLTVILLKTFKNRLINNSFLYALPSVLLFILITSYFANFQLIFLELMFFGYVILVNLVMYFFRFDLNFIMVTFMIMLGFLFRIWHIPGGGPILTLSALLLVVFSIVIAIRAFKFKSNQYLSIVVFSCSFILSGVSVSFILKIQHLPGAGLLMTIFVPLFIIATLIILLTLPSSNFIEWTRQQKKILTRGLLIPWLFFLYILVTSALIPPQDVIKPFFFIKERSAEVHFDMVDYEPENKNGLKKEE